MEELIRIQKAESEEERKQMLEKFEADKNAQLEQQKAEYIAMVEAENEKKRQEMEALG